jgi:hypothetical protein
MYAKQNWAISLVLLIFVLNACAPQAQGVPVAVTVVTSTKTPEPTVTPSRTPRPTRTQTSTEAPDPGVEELKKISDKILDGGAIQYFGNDMTDFAARSDGTWHFTESHRELVFFKVVDVPHLLIVDRHSRWAVGVGVLYYRYQIPNSVDFNKLIQEATYVLPIGAPVTLMLYGVNVALPKDDFLTVEFDYVHSVGQPAQTWKPAIETRGLNTGDILKFNGWMLVTGTCTDSKVKTQIIAKGTLEVPCPMNRASLENIYFASGKNNTPREGTEEENLKLMWYLMRISIARADETNFGIERYMQVEVAYLGWQPLDHFSTLHPVQLTETVTVAPTSTRTPELTYTPRPTQTSIPAP